MSLGAVGKGLLKAKSIYKRKPLTDKQIENLLVKAVEGPDKRTAAQKKAAQAIYKSTFREP